MSSSVRTHWPSRWVGRGRSVAPRRWRRWRCVAARGRAWAAQPVLVNGAVGVVVAPRGRLMMVLDFTIRHGKIVAIDAIADPERLAALELAVLAG